jgi:hypothetical protein
MLSEDRIVGLFRMYLDPDVKIINLSAKAMTEQALGHPYVQLQMQIGIYNEENIAADFLSPARAHSDERLQVISVEIFTNILEGIPDDVADDYICHVAVHEAHHFHKDHQPVSAADHSASELECAREIMAAHPEFNNAVAFVEANSPVYRRVYARVEKAKQDIITKNGAR